MNPVGVREIEMNRERRERETERKRYGEKIVTNGIQFRKATLNDWRQILSFKRKSLSIND